MPDPGFPDSSFGNCFPFLAKERATFSIITAHKQVWGNVIFLQASVILSTGEGGCCPEGGRRKVL